MKNIEKKESDKLISELLNAYNGLMYFRADLIGDEAKSVDDVLELLDKKIDELYEKSK